MKQAASEIVPDSVLASSSWIWRALGTPTRAQTARLVSGLAKSWVEKLKF